jgi:oxygen-independent coproporphyrinogen-3 oxidase
VPLGVYVHWPFCTSLCPYCDFNSHVAGAIDPAQWRDAYLRELTHYAGLAGRRMAVSIFFGGGTPSLMDPATVGAVIDAVAGHFEVAGDIEITLEANPGSVDAERFAGFAAAGVNRVSLGVQALDDDALRFLGRRHSVAEACNAIDLARRHFARSSFDLIYARPGQTVAAWRHELDAALAFAPNHLSVYQLTIEPGTPFFLRRAEGRLSVPDEAIAADLYEATRDTLDAAGLAAYEISNHAVPGAECRHNLGYWRYDDYLGVGPGAHGRLTRDGAVRATRQHRAPAIWLQRVEERGHATQTDAPVDVEDRAVEALMMGLRLAAGVDAAHFAARVGQSLDSRLDPTALARLAAAGFVEFDGRTLRATAAGRQRLDAVLAALLA